jgi:hypothetical protein
MFHSQFIAMVSCRDQNCKRLPQDALNRSIVLCGLRLSRAAELVKAVVEGCNPLPYSTSTGDLLVPLSWHSGSHASFDMEMTGLGVYAMRTILQNPSYYRSGSHGHPTT